MRKFDNMRSRVEAERPLVGFIVGGGHYAVDVPAVREIVAPVALVMVPHASPIVIGVTDHRGHVVPVVNLRKRFGLPPAEASVRSKWIIVETDSQWLGLAVDGVTEVFSVNATMERMAPRLGPDDVARGFSRVYSHDGHLVMVLDLAVIGRAVEQGSEAVPLPSLAPPSPENVR